MRIAIIGTGISGLTAAHHLHRGHDLTLFEAGDHIGGHTNTLEVELDGQRFAIDTGFIVFNESNYPNFTALLRELGVASQPTSMSFSVRCDRTGLEYNGSSLNQIFAQRSNLLSPRFLGMLRDIARFNREAMAMRGDLDDDITVDTFVRSQGFGSMFYEKYLIPLGASLWSCPAHTFRRFPIRFVVDFLRNHTMLQYAGRPVWRTIVGGSKQYIAPLTAPFRGRIRLRTPVRQVRRCADHVEIASVRDMERFDHVILACHADTALSLLADPSPTERELLSAFPYQPNEAILHTDTSVLPRRRRAWASWNYHIPREESDQVAVTYNMNMLQNLRLAHGPMRHTFCVTLNHDAGIDPARILRRIPYHHPIYTTRRAAAQVRHCDLLNTNRTSFCGAYWGFGFHEDGVNSGLAVARAIPASHPAPRALALAH